MYLFGTHAHTNRTHAVWLADSMQCSSFVPRDTVPVRTACMHVPHVLLMCALQLSSHMHGCSWPGACMHVCLACSHMGAMQCVTPGALQLTGRLLRQIQGCAWWAAPALRLQLPWCLVVTVILLHTQGAAGAACAEPRGVSFVAASDLLQASPLGVAGCCWVLASARQHVSCRCVLKRAANWNSTCSRLL
jgi:hypothetical protein